MTHALYWIHGFYHDDEIRPEWRNLAENQLKSTIFGLEQQTSIKVLYSDTKRGYLKNSAILKISKKVAKIPSLR